MSEFRPNWAYQKYGILVKVKYTGRLATSSRQVSEMADKRSPKNPVSRDEYVISRLRQVLRRHKDKSTWRQISNAILEANGGEGNATVDRRTLPLICSDDEFDQVRLSLGQLIALDKYFVFSEEGPLFARNRSLVDSIAESPAVAFYVAAKYHKALYSEAVSGFDVRAIMTLLRTRLGRMDISISDISEPKDWHKAKVGSESIANVAIGSPIANNASDALLSSMLGFGVNKNTRPERLPFFIVRRSRERSFTSGFVRTKLHAVRRNATDAERITKDERALVIEDRVFVCSDRIDYALLVAQRNPDGGHVRVVISGLTGLGTLELAKILRAGGPMIELPELRRKEKHPPILAVVYKFTVEGRRSKVKNARESRRIAGSTPIYGPMFLNYIDGVWRSAAQAN
jgi:hypothetical protein